MGFGKKQGSKWAPEGVSVRVGVPGEHVRQVLWGMGSGGQITVFYFSLYMPLSPFLEIQNASRSFKI